MSYLNKVKKQAERQRRESQNDKQRQRRYHESETAKAKRKAEDQPYPLTKLKVADEKNPEAILEVLSCSNCRRPIKRNEDEAVGMLGSLLARFVRPKPHRPSTCPGP